QWCMLDPKGHCDDYEGSFFEFEFKEVSKIRINREVMIEQQQLEWHNYSRRFNFGQSPKQV
ncbi:MAG: hypothetical protein EZS28_042570, partial [Streblomastix strix]